MGSPGYASSVPGSGGSRGCHPWRAGKGSEGWQETAQEWAALRRDFAGSPRLSLRPWWKPWLSPSATRKDQKSVARKRARPSSFEEMLQTLRASYRLRLAPPLGGFVYRFTIYLPLLSEGREVFSV